MTASLPVIDLTDLGDPTREAALLARWNDAFCHYGFCYLTSHGLQPLLERVEAEALQFFTSLTPAEKAAFYLNKGYGYGGYVAAGIESVASSRNPRLRKKDPVESLCVHSSKAEHVPPFCYEDVLLDVPYKYGNEFKQSVQELWKGLERVLMQIMTISAKALKLPSDQYFHQFYQPGANFMRFAHYVDEESVESSSDDDDEITRYGEHTDYQGFTLLWRNQSNGLQCARDMRHILQTNDAIQNWIDVPVLPDDPHALVVNAGDLIQRWTNDYWVSNMHRVVAKKNTSTDKKEPLSIVFFTGPAHETKIEQLPSPLLDGEEPKYEAVTAGDHLKMKIEPTSISE